MEYAGWLGQASKVAAEVYRMLPRNKQQVTVYRKMTGAAMRLVREGKDPGTVKAQLMQEYLQQVQCVQQPAPVVLRQVVRRPAVVSVRKVVPLFCTGQRMAKRTRGLRIMEKRGISRGRVCKRE
jgi:hypothetical protein